MKRGDYASLDENHLKFFRDLLEGGGRVLSDPSDCEGYNVDWIKNVRGIRGQPSFAPLTKLIKIESRSCCFLSPSLFVRIDFFLTIDGGGVL